MSSLEVNKACAAVLVAGLSFMLASTIGDMAVRPKKLEKPAISIAAPKVAGGGAPAAPELPFPALLAAADPHKGEVAVTQQGCVACHSFNEGGKAGIGPNLYGVVGGPHGHMAGFDYSSGMKAKRGPWTFDELNEWLTKPAAYIPGTKMTFMGVGKPDVRANIIAYLDSLSPNPLPLPKASAPAAQGQQATQPSPNQNQPQVQTNQSQQPPQVTK